MSKTGLLAISNGQATDLANVPLLDIATFRTTVITEVSHGSRLAAFFGYAADPDKVELMAVCADGREGTIGLCRTKVHQAYPALTTECPAAHWFEREIAEQWAIRPEGHPWLKPIRFHSASRHGHDAWGRPENSPIEPAVTEYFQMEGEGIHEVAVGPVHAGIIEPGHFRFQCHGEDVYHLEISLGYQHRGVEQAMLGGPDKRTIHYLETLAGDTTVGHTLAYTQLLEALNNCLVPPRAQVLRGIALELERLANHTGDLGALAGDVGYLPTASYCGRIRGDFLNMTALICGNRFGRRLIRLGGTGFDLETSRCTELLKRLHDARQDVEVAIGLLWNTQSVLARFEGTGTISKKICHDLGLVGVAARACGLEQDARQEFPIGIYQFAQIPVSSMDSGDVFGRAYVRWLEILRSLEFLIQELKAMPDGPIQGWPGSLPPDKVGVSLVEGWRGEICHVAITDQTGRFARYKVVDPSFHNWMGLAMALRGQQISDFPLCNKSFNLSYCGHDL
ncbi:MAG: hydrogenase [Phycisphaerales bacterium]|nr:hydrogenase [Phycisphaerales bacterium]